MKKIIIITGASSGIGKATALQLIKEGHTVYGVARRLEHMKELVAAGGKAIEIDVTDHNQVHSQIKKIIEAEGKIDVLVNNAGYAVYGPIEEVSYEQAKRQFDVNLFGLAEVTKAVLPIMRNQQSGSIINVSSIGGKVYGPLGAWYNASKFALEGWSDCLRLDVNQFGIKVIVIQPGVINTGFAKAMDHHLEDSNSPYKELKQIVAKMMQNTSKPGQYSEPSVIAKTISKAIKSKKPKTRYAAGKMARQTLLARKLLSDKAFDKMFLNMVKNYGK
ncbi:short chain dehydrogenase [Formosa agariphila KMM 3901]|uniref:Short chain dehydrogenase n=1 Tax=Formosa agariphila (strain DSM 15362 / KCTC 12365 / LMG 23005 / KMM 3901 / M-2Alg 35-1) TaxID=1347342 RepID=T2KRY5_FORAG|nr:oxidoreductase [Formosa agariphila]CDF80824.1 short chain dehydrogenase [Formosa agariphila KMM 3901]